jgi:hypothetical protein
MCKIVLYLSVVILFGNMPLKDKIIEYIIPYAMGTVEFDETKFEQGLRHLLRYYLARKEYTYAEIDEALARIDTNLDGAIENVEMRKKIRNAIRRVRNFARLYKNLIR